MVKISNLYFDVLKQLDNSIVQWDPDCYRLENGMLTGGLKVPDAIIANLPALKSAPHIEWMSEGDTHPVGTRRNGPATICRR